MRCSLALISALFLLAVAAAPAPAAPGALDPTFGTGGFVASPTAATNEEPSDVAVQTDGKILVAGTSSADKMMVVRYLPGGAIDETFGFDGIATPSFGSTDDTESALAIQPDGKILVGGQAKSTAPSTYGQFAVARLTTAGQPDTDFNSTGSKIIPLTTHTDQINDIAVQADGDIVLAGVAEVNNSPNPNYSGFALARLTSTGAADSTFATPQGTFLYIFNQGFNGAAAVAIQPDQKIVVCGHAIQAGTDPGDFGLLRLDTHGSLDPTFNGTGKIAVPLGTDYDSCGALAIQSDGKIVAAGSVTPVPATYFGRLAVARFTTDGHLDPTFGTGGYTIDPRGLNYGYGNDVAIQPDGRILVAGQNKVGEPNIMAAALERFTTTGAPDPSFGSAGLATFTQELRGTGLALTADQKALVAGPRLEGAHDDFGVLRVQLAEDPPPVGKPSASARIENPTKSKLARSRFTKISGSASSVNAAVAKVEVAVFRAGPKKSKSCLWLKSSKAKFRKLKRSKKTGCSKQVWLLATGTTRWSYKLKKPLPAGKYKLYVRATPADGAPGTAFSSRSGNLKPLTLTR